MKVYVDRTNKQIQDQGLTGRSSSGFFLNGIEFYYLVSNKRKWAVENRIEEGDWYDPKELEFAMKHPNDTITQLSEIWTDGDCDTDGDWDERTL